MSEQMFSFKPSSVSEESVRPCPSTTSSWRCTTRPCATPRPPSSTPRTCSTWRWRPRRWPRWPTTTPRLRPRRPLVRISTHVCLLAHIYFIYNLTKYIIPCQALAFASLVQRGSVILRGISPTRVTCYAASSRQWSPRTSSWTTPWSCWWSRWEGPTLARSGTTSPPTLYRRLLVA